MLGNLALLAMHLSLFDLDNTLLSCDSDYEWGQFLIDRGVVDRAAYEARNRTYYEQYLAGTLDIHEYLGFALRPLAEHTPDELARWQADFWRVLDGDLAAAESAALSEHIRSCMNCRTFAVESVAMHRKLLEAAAVKKDLVAAEPAPMQASRLEMQCVVPPRVMEPRRERTRPRVIVIDWRMIGAAAVVVLTLLAWAVPGGAAEGIAEIRNALRFRTFDR